MSSARIGVDEEQRTLEYSYNDRGDVTSISGPLSQDATTPDVLHIDYDAHGAVKALSSQSIQRNYKYFPNGAIQELQSNGKLHTFAFNEDGQLASTETDGKTIGFKYRSDGKLEKTVYWDKSEVSYELDPLGTRSYADWGDQGHVSFTYNRAGSARAILIGNSEEVTGGHVINLDDNQRVQSVVYNDGGSFEVKYNAEGNPVRVTSSKGDDSAYGYDDYGRLTTIHAAGKEILNHQYQPTDDDLRFDDTLRRPTTFSTSRRVSISFGHAQEIFLTRMQGSGLGPVVFDESIVGFRLVSPTAMALDDAPLYDGLTRARILGSGREGHEDKDYFEKPSNILFIPPEYSTMNCCIPCDPVTQSQLCDTCWWKPGFPETIKCYCSAPPPPAYCTPQFIQQGAIDVVREWPQREPYERGVSLRCDGPNLLTFGFYSDSFGIHYPGTGTNDPCSTRLTGTDDWAAAAHSHPYFTTAAQYRAGNGCHGDNSFPSSAQLNALNTANNNFSSGDISEFRCRSTPLYLRSANGSYVKKLLGNPGVCNHATSTVYP